MLELQTITEIKPHQVLHKNKVNDQSVQPGKSTGRIVDKSSVCTKGSGWLQCSAWRYGRRDAPKSSPNFPCEIGNKLCELMYKKQGLLLTQESLLRETPLQCNPFKEDCKWKVAKKSIRKVERKFETNSIEERSELTNRISDCDPRLPHCRWMTGKRAGKSHVSNSKKGENLASMEVQDNSRLTKPCLKGEFACGVFYGRRNDIPANKKAQVNNINIKNHNMGGFDINPKISTSSTAAKLAVSSDKPLLEIFTEHPKGTRYSMLKQTKYCKSPYCRYRFLMGK